MMVFISILIWITYSTFAIAIFDLDKKDPVTKKIIWPKTKKNTSRYGLVYYPFLDWLYF